jgi:hypothetical protein
MQLRSAWTGTLPPKTPLSVDPYSSARNAWLVKEHGEENTAAHNTEGTSRAIEIKRNTHACMLLVPAWKIFCVLIGVREK